MGRLIDESKVFEVMKHHWLSGSIAHHIIDDIRTDIIKNVPTVDAIPKDQYEQRFKADLEAMLTEIQLEIHELIPTFSYSDGDFISGKKVEDIIQEKINNLQVNNSKVKEQTSGKD